MADKPKISLTAGQVWDRLKLPFFVLAFVFLNFFALRNFYLLSRDMIFGDQSAQQLSLAPRYSPRRIPLTSFTKKYNAVDRLGADFAQIYFPAQEMSSPTNAYNSSDTPDPWGRPSRYAPLVLGLCALTICRLDYGYASLANILLQLLLFFPALYFVFRALDLKTYFLPSLLLVEFCLFLTPVGLAWIERGQFSIYVGISHLLLMFGLLRKKVIWVLLAACLAFVKWTSLPLSFVILAVFILNSRSFREIRFGSLAAALFGLVFVLLLLPYIGADIPFVQGLLSQELFGVPASMSLLRFFPPAVVKLIPFLLILLGFIHCRLMKAPWVAFIPFAAGAAILLLIYPTEAFDYSIPTILSFIPLMLFWVLQSPPEQRIPAGLLTGTFVLFLVFASFSVMLTGSVWTVILGYLAASTVLVISPAVLDRIPDRRTSI